MGQQIAIDQEVRMLALGDSYTIGESVEADLRWPSQFVSNLRLQGVTADDPDYIATTGWTTSDLIQGIRKNLDTAIKYNLVSILIGVNNQYQGIDISVYEPELRQIIQTALGITGNDTLRVLMLSIPDYAYTPFGKGDATISNEIDKYNAINKRIAGEMGIAYVDITPLSRLGLVRTELVAGDGLHPSGQQYREWIDLIIPLMNK
jgi:lysophospholipase L1-like esterase